LSAAYGGPQAKIAKDGKLIDGTPKDYDFFNTETNRSGIGFTRGDRQALQQALSSYQWSHNQAAMQKLAGLIGVKQGGDVIHGLFAFLNDAKNRSAVKAEAQKIIDASNDVLAKMRADAPKMTAQIEKAGLPAVRGFGAHHAPSNEHAATKFIGRPRFVA